MLLSPDKSEFGSFAAKDPHCKHASKEMLQLATSDLRAAVVSLRTASVASAALADKRNNLLTSLTLAFLEEREGVGY